jgi:riboflavin synthase
MFTGLIETVGHVRRLQGGANGTSGCHLRVETALGAALHAGESIAVNGVCLTAATVDPAGFDAVVSPQTLRVTTLGGLESGRAVNLERAVRADARLGGHVVLGHVDGIARLTGVRDDGESRWIDVELPEALLAGVVDKGSVALDGVSLTVARVEGRTIGLQIVPFTWTHTALGHAKPGDAMNVETDVIGKYVARIMGLAPATPVEHQR